MCYRAKFGHSRSNHTSVINGDPPEKFDPSRPACQGHSRSATYECDFLLMVRSDHRPITYTVYEINGDLGQKSQNRPFCLTPALREFPFEFCNGGSAQKQCHALTRKWKEFNDMCIHLDIPECDGQTDGRIC